METHSIGECIMNVLVVGGAGYVGGAVTDILQAEGYSLRVYDSLLYEGSYRKPVDFCFGDLRDEKRLLPHLKWADAVVWLAAIVGDPACALNPELAGIVNGKSLGILTESFKGRIVFTSTCSVYGAQDSVIDETAPLKPLSLYAISKLNAEKTLQDHNSIIFRLGTLYGISDTYSRIRLDLVVNTLTVRAYANNKVIVFGGDQHRPLLHVRDAARAIVDSLKASDVGVFNLHSENMRIIELAERLRRHFPDLIVERTDLRFQDNRTYRVSSDKARKRLGFKPKLTVDDGIEEFKLLLEQGRIRNLADRRYVNAEYLAVTLNSQPHSIDAEMPSRV